ncbi:hypothetical protein, partial [Streptomyces bugieae]|nr:hypothetical protein [Streptomyces sp. DSM 41528]
PAHLYLKRAKADSIAYGTAGRHREAVAELAELPRRRTSVKPRPWCTRLDRRDGVYQGLLRAV